MKNLNNKFSLEIFSKAFILELSLYLRIDFNAGLLISLEMESDTEYSSKRRFLMMVEKKVFKTFAIVVSTLNKFQTSLFFSSDGGSSERKGLTVFQKVLLSMIFFHFKLL